MRTPLNFTRRPAFDVVLVVAVIGLMVAAYAIAGLPWPIEPVAPAAPVVQTSLVAGHAPSG